MEETIEDVPTATGEPALEAAINETYAEIQTLPDDAEVERAALLEKLRGLEAEDAAALRARLAAEGPLPVGEIDAALAEARAILARYESAVAIPEALGPPTAAYGTPEQPAHISIGHTPEPFQAIISHLETENALLQDLFTKTRDGWAEDREKLEVLQGNPEKIAAALALARAAEAFAHDGVKGPEWNRALARWLAIR